MSATYDVWGPVESGLFEAYYEAGQGYTMSGGGVQYWDDLTGHGHTFGFQILPTPIASDAAYDGRPTLDMSPNCYGFSTGWAGFSNPVTIFVAGECHGSSGGFISLASYADGLLYALSSSTVSLYTSGLQITDTGLDANPTCLIGVLNGASSRLYVKTRTAVTGTTKAITSSNGIWLGKWGTSPLNGKIACAGIALSQSTTMDNLIIRWMAHRYKLILRA